MKMKNIYVMMFVFSLVSCAVNAMNDEELDQYHSLFVTTEENNLRAIADNIMQTLTVEQMRTMLIQNGRQSALLTQNFTHEQIQGEIILTDDQVRRLADYFCSPVYLRRQGVLYLAERQAGATPQQAMELMTLTMMPENALRIAEIRGQAPVAAQNNNLPN